MAGNTVALKIQMRTQTRFDWYDDQAAAEKAAQELNENEQLLAMVGEDLKPIEGTKAAGAKAK